MPNLPILMNSTTNHPDSANFTTRKIRKQNYLQATPSLNIFLKQFILSNPNSLYPPPEILTKQNRWVQKHLQVRQSSFPFGGLGPFTLIDIPENTAIGIYGGRLTKHKPACTDYALQLNSITPAYSHFVDAADHLAHQGILGRINEFVWTKL